MEVLFAASSAALPTDAGRFTERELHAPNEDSLLHPALVGQVHSCPATQRPVASVVQVSADL